MPNVKHVNPKAPSPAKLQGADMNEDRHLRSHRSGENRLRLRNHGFTYHVGGSEIPNIHLKTHEKPCK